MKRKLLIVFLIPLIFLPQIVAKFGHSKIEKIFEKHLGGETRIDKIHLSWFGKQTGHGFTWSTERFILVADKILLVQKKTLRVHVEGARIQTASNMRFLKKNLDLQFSLIDAVIEQQIITFEPVHIQINQKKSVRINGEMNFAANTMNITLGVPRETLQKVFKEAKNLPSDFLLEIPIHTQLNGKAFEKELLKYFIKNYATVTSLHK